MIDLPQASYICDFPSTEAINSLDLLTKRLKKNPSYFFFEFGTVSVSSLFVELFRKVRI